MTGKIIEFTESNLEGIHKFGMVKLLVELDEKGFPNREIGLDQFGEIVHRYPDPREKSYSVFSDGPILMSDTYVDSELVTSNFEFLWDK